jgi:beta-N-acetylhexosaminidase
MINYLIILNKLKEESTKNILIENNTLDFDSLTLRQKIAQMIIVRGDYKRNVKLNNLNIGGIFLDRQNSEEDYKNLIEEYQNNSKIKLLVSTDLEGAWSPFNRSKKEYDFPYFSNIKTKEEAYIVGQKHGLLLKKLGFNINFAPVSEFDDLVYGGRAFSGNKEEIKEKLSSYIRGLQEDVLGTCKHYPGKGMIKNLHHRADKQDITKEDLELFEVCFENNISAVMIGHQKTIGEINSNNKPASVSGDVIKNLKNFGGLIMSDEVNMMGVRINYFRKASLYKDMINSGENVILDFKLGPVSTFKLISSIEEKVKEGEISEESINNSVKKVLKAKGYRLRSK